MIRILINNQNFQLYACNTPILGSSSIIISYSFIHLFIILYPLSLCRLCYLSFPIQFNQEFAMFLSYFLLKQSHDNSYSCVLHFFSVFFLLFAHVVELNFINFQSRAMNPLYFQFQLLQPTHKIIHHMILILNLPYFIFIVIVLYSMEPFLSNLLFLS